MRRKHVFSLLTIPATLLVLAIFSAADPPAPAPPTPPGPSSPLKVILATPEHNTWQISDDKSHLSVILVNTSDKPIDLYDAWNAWGGYNVKLEWQTKDAKGTVAMPTPLTRAFPQNPPTTTEVPPGGAMVLEVNLQKDWIGWPDRIGGQTMTIRAVYESRVEGDVKSGWQGKIESAPVTIETRDKRLGSALGADAK